MKAPDWGSVQKIINSALEEDIAAGDVTSASINYEMGSAEAFIIARQAGIVAGLEVAERVFKARDAQISITRLAKDGQQVAANQKLLQIRGQGNAILEAERTALNILGRMSGIATKTGRFVELVKDEKAIILDTRKTAPGLRELDKYAVRLGGGHNHRHNLNDMILLKENHIAFAGGMQKAVAGAIAYAKQCGRPLPVEVEVRNMDELEQAALFDVDRIMLDNFSVTALKDAVQKYQGRVPFEASGGVSLASVASIASTGVDFISVGELTHSVINFDMSLLFTDSCSGEN